MKPPQIIPHALLPYLLIIALSLIIPSNGEKLISSNSTCSQPGLELKCRCTDTQIECSSLTPADVVLRLILTSEILQLRIHDSRVPVLSFDEFRNAPNLELISLRNSHIEFIDASSSARKLAKVSTLDLADNKIYNISALCSVVNQYFPKLQNLHLTNNRLDTESARPCVLTSKSLKNLDLSGNDLARLPLISESVEKLNLSYNSLVRMEEWRNSGTKIQHLDLSHNKITTWKSADLGEMQNLRSLNLSNNQLGQFSASSFASLKNLQRLDLSYNRITSLPTFSDHYALAEIYMRGTELEYFNATQLRGLRSLKVLSLADNPNLEWFLGKKADLSSARTVDISQCAFFSLPLNFFEIIPNLRRLHTSDNPWACDCRLLWLSGASALISRRLSTSKPVCSAPEFRLGQPLTSVNLSNLTDCQLEIAPEVDLSVARFPYGSDAKLRCQHFGDPAAAVHWERAYPFGYIGKWDGLTGKVSEITEKEKYQILPGGTLKLFGVTRRNVGRYVCTASNKHGNVSATIIFRLGYNWNIMKIYSIICAIGTALAFFALNMIWAGIRSIVLWRISQLERTSRVRKMLEAMEKYRQRQAECLHEKYTSKVNAIRENYRLQAEQLRRSYSSQLERFRDYKAQQMGAVSQHVESVRDSYAAQMGRVREYGSRHMERVSESYQRQMNRIRTFSLQQRLRLMRQYKIKQRYLNKLLEGLNIDYYRTPPDNPDCVEMLQLPRLGEDDEDDPLGLPRSFSAELFLRPRSSDADNLELDAVSLSTYHSLAADLYSPEIEADLVSRSSTEHSFRDISDSTSCLNEDSHRETSC